MDRSDRMARRLDVKFIESFLIKPQYLNDLKRIITPPIKSLSRHSLNNLTKSRLMYKSKNSPNVGYSTL